MPEFIKLPGRWGVAEICADVPRIACARGHDSRSYDHLGNRLRWLAPAGLDAKKVACDCEDSGRDVSFMAARLGVVQSEFHSRWVASEVLAKLADIPVLLWIKSHGLFPCELGVALRAKIPGGTARLMVVAKGARTMAFGFLR